MFDIGFPELLLVSIVALLVFGPERLPEVLRTLGGWMGSARRSFGNLKAEIEREVGADDIRRELHNNRIMEEARRLEEQVSSSRDEVEELLGKGFSGRTGSDRSSDAKDADAAADRADDDQLQEPGNDAGTGTGPDAGEDGDSPQPPDPDPDREDGSGTPTDDAPRTDDDAEDSSRR